jgi:hypothetical protein
MRTFASLNGAGTFNLFVNDQTIQSVNFTSSDNDAIVINFNRLPSATLEALQNQIASLRQVNASIFLTNFVRDRGQNADFRVIYSFSHDYSVSNVAIEVGSVPREVRDIAMTAVIPNVGAANANGRSFNARITVNNDQNFPGQIAAIIRQPSCLGLDVNAAQSLVTSGQVTAIREDNLDGEVVVIFASLNGSKTIDVPFTQEFAGTCPQRISNAYLVYGNNL